MDADSEELPADLGYRLRPRRTDTGRHAGFIEANVLGSVTGWKVEVPGDYASLDGLRAEGLRTFNRFVAGEVRAISYRLVEKYRGYRLTGTSRYHLDGQWLPSLEMKKVEQPNKGRRIDVSGFPQLLQVTPERAAQYAVEYGQRVAIGLVGNVHAFLPNEG